MTNPHPLAALIAGVKVKPLEWEAGERDQRCADSILGEFCVTFFGGRWFYQGEPRKGMLDAQAAAQADYEARILAALEAAPVPDLVEAAIAELQDVMRCRCDKAFTDRGMHDPDCQCDSQDALDTLIALATAQAAQIAGLTKERDQAHDDDLIRRGDALAAIQLGDTVTKLQARIRAIPCVDADPVCTGCGGTGVTYQTERRCACQGPDLTNPVTVHANMLRGTIAPAAHHVNETPKSEHDRADVLTALEGEKPDKWQCPINYPGCKKNCGGYGCGN